MDKETVERMHAFEGNILRLIQTELHTVESKVGENLSAINKKIVEMERRICKLIYTINYYHQILEKNSK